MSTNAGGSQRCRPESNSAPGPAHSSKLGKLTNLSTGVFHYESLDGNTSRKSVADEGSWMSWGGDRLEVACSCGSFLGSRVKQLGGRNRSKVSGRRREDKHETSPAAAGFFFRLLASYGRIRESIRTTNLTVYDLFVGNQMMFLMTASPIPWAKAKTGLPGDSSRRRPPMLSFPSSSSSGLGQSDLPDVSFKSTKSLPGVRSCIDSNARQCRLSSQG